MTKKENISLPSPFFSLVDDIINRKDLGFESREEVIKAAVRTYHDKYINSLIQNKNIPKSTPLKTKVGAEKTEVSEIKITQKPNSPGKLIVNEPMKKQFKDSIVKIIKQQIQFPFRLAELKNKACELCNITQSTKPYTGKFSTYIQSLIDEFKLPVGIDNADLVKLRKKG